MFHLLLCSFVLAFLPCPSLAVTFGSVCMCSRSYCTEGGMKAQSHKAIWYTNSYKFCVEQYQHLIHRCITLCLAACSPQLDYSSTVVIYSLFFSKTFFEVYKAITTHCGAIALLFFVSAVAVSVAAT